MYDTDRIVELLKQYNLYVTSSGNEIYIRCPYPERHVHGDRDRSASFNLEKNKWYCFGCDSRGSIINIIMANEGISFEQSLDLFENNIIVDANKELQITKEKIKQLEMNLSYSRSNYTQGIWADLNKSLKPYHPYLNKRGITKETASLFNVGYDILSECIALPVFNLDKSILAVQARQVFDRKPKYTYIIPGEHSKSFFGIQLIKDWSRPIIVEGAFSAMKFTQYGHNNVIATLGNPSIEQIEIISTLAKRPILMFDNDNQGWRDTAKFVDNCHLPCRVPSIEWGETDELTKEEVASTLASLEYTYG